MKMRIAFALWAGMLALVAGSPRAEAALALGGATTNYTDAGGTNWTAHIFTNVGVAGLEVTAGGDAEVLVVAGGGGGGDGTAGGGGAGGYLYTNLTLVAGSNYTVTVGDGGLGGTGGYGTTPTMWGQNGSNSIFGSLTAFGGGGGAPNGGGQQGKGGGSGGGGSESTSPTSAGAGTNGQGYAGGYATSWGGVYGAGGGGGAGGAGTNGTSSAGGTGGNGKQNGISGTATWYAGGGGGGVYSGASSGAGGSGVGGTGGGGSIAATSGQANTGSGGGGQGANRNSAASSHRGGSGIVVVRYVLTYPDTPWVQSQSATAVMSNSATLNGLLVSTGSSACAVGVLWGPQDGGQSMAWANTTWFNGGAANPAWTNNTPFSTNIILASDAVYTYRYCAINASGTNWSGVQTFMTGPVTVQSTQDGAEKNLRPGLFTLYRPVSCTGFAQTVTYSLSGAASNGVDYATLPGAVTFDAASVSATVTVTPITDALAEGPETVILTLSSVATNFLIGTPQAATMTIADIPTTNTWTGNGDANNSGNWSDGANWSLSVPPGPTHIAVLPEVTANGNDGVASRTVTNDAATTVDELLMTQSNGSYPNQIVLTADLSVGRVAVSPDSDAGVNACRINVNGRTLTVGLNDQKSRAGGGRGIPYCSGSGTIVKVGTNEVGLSYNSTIGFTGTYRVDNGFLVGNYGRIQGTVVVNTGGTYQITANGGENRPLFLRGFGCAGTGAFRVDCTMTRSAGIMISNDASITVSGSYVLTQQGALSGTGRLYKAGSGKLILTANSSAYTNGMVVLAGTLEVTGILSGSPVTVQSNAVLVAPAYRVGTVTVEPGGIWSNTSSAVWIKGASFDGNDDGCWSDAANWATAEVPTNLAILGDVTGNGNDGTSTRTVSNMTAFAVSTLEMRQTTSGYVNKLKLFADAAIDTIVLNPDTDAARQLCQIDVNGRTLTVGSNDARVANYPVLAGGGTVIKMGTNYAQFSYYPGYTWNGVYVVKGGRTYLVYNRVSGIRYWVQNGGSLHIDGTSYLNYSGNEVSIEGQGYANYGSLYVSGDVPGANFTAALVVTNDAVLRVDSGRTLSLNGPLRGPGTLTMGGGGTLDLNGTWTCRFTGTAINGIVVTNGTVDIAGCTLTVTNTAGITSGQYVLVDYSSPSGALTGSFAATNGLPPNWYLADRGRRLMLLPPPAGAVFTMR